MKKSEKRHLSRQQKLSALLAAVNGLGNVIPLAVPATASLAELPPPRRQEVDTAWMAGLARGGQILDSLLFSTAYAATTIITASTVVGNIPDGIIVINGGTLLEVQSVTIGPAPSGYAVEMRGNNNLLTTKNSSTISGTTEGVYFNNISSGTAMLAGTVTGGVAGVGISGGSANVVTISGGTVTGSICGVRDGGSSDRVTINGGTVSGGTYGIAVAAITGTTLVPGGSAAIVTINGGTVTGGSAGIALTGSSGTVTLSGGTVSGGAYGIADSGTGAIVNIAGGTVSGGTAAVAVTGASDQVNVTGSTAVSGVILNGTANTLNVNNGTVSGLTVGGSGNSVNIAGAGTVLLSAGSTVGGTVNNSGALTLSGASGSYNISTLNLTGGTVAFSSAQTAGRALSLTNLAGAGSFKLYANPAAGYADRITVTGAASGSHQLYITNTGGATGTGQIVKVVDLPSGSTANFSGGGDVGAYRYTVAKGSYLSTSLDAEDYYFTNSGPSATSQAAMGLSSGTTMAWYGEMNEIKKRMGDLHMGSQSSDDFWARTYASKINVKPGVSDGASQIMRGFEVGKDNPQTFTGGKKYTGFVFGVARNDATYNAGGSGTTDSNYAGAYASWLRDDGNFLDLIGKYNWFSNRFNTTSDSGSYRNTGFGLSAEIGKRFDKGNGTYIEPAAELAALWAGKASYTTANGLEVEVPAANSLQLRLGVTAGRSWKDADGANRQLYGKISWLNEYRGDSTTRVDSAVFDSSLKGHQWVTGLGFVEDTGHYQLYVDLEKSWGNSVSKAWGVNLGYRWKF